MSPSEPASRRQIVRAVVGVVVAWAVLHGLLRLLWNRPAGWFQVGFPSPHGPDLASIITLPWLVLLLSVAMTRLWQSHPAAIGYFRTVPRCLALYLGAMPVVALLEQALDFHFVPSIGIHAALGVLLLAACFGGERPPFRHLRLDWTPRRWADVTALVLMALAYAEFAWDAEIWAFGLDEIGDLRWWVLQAVATALYVLLAWALIHSHALAWFGRGVAWLASRAPSTAPAFARVWLAHVVAAVLVLQACRLFSGWATHLSESGRWFFPHEGPSVALGVDWYFVTVIEVVRAYEIALPLLVAWFMGPLLSRARGSGQMGP